MIWNYRVFRGQDGTILACGEPAQITADSIHELTGLLDGLREAWASPILTLNDVPKQTESDQRPAKSTLSHRALLVELGLEHKSEKQDDD